MDPRFSTLLKCERSELKKHKLHLFCLQNGTSFGKSQLLHGVKLANQNKNKKAGNFKSHFFIVSFNKCSKLDRSDNDSLNH